MRKLQRNYRIEFEIGSKDTQGSLINYVPEQALIVEYPISLELDIKENTFAQSNTGHFILYNLAPKTRALLYLDKLNFKKYVTMRVYAGYGDEMPMVFYGDILQCYSYRKGGQTEFRTEILATDMMYLFQRGYANYTFSENTSPQNLIKTLLLDVPNLDIGYISESLPSSPVPQTFWGKTFDLLKREYVGYEIYIKNGELNILSSSEVVPSQINVITNESGLLGSPRRNDLVLEAEMIFEPGLIIGQAVTLLSSTVGYFNGIYKLIALEHSGLISPTESSVLRSKLTLSLGGQPLQQLTKVTNNYQPQGTSGSWIKPTSSGYITSPFGYRSAFKTSSGISSSQHAGIDIGVSEGTSVKAVNSGTVLFTGSKGGYGYTVMINHGKINNINVVSLYGHLKSFSCKSGDTVSQGQEIAKSGGSPAAGYAKSGSSTGPHLHFEIRENGAAVNPSKYIGSY